MKVLKLILIIAAGFLLQLPCSAGQPNFSITSPDRPPVWYNRAGDKLSQYLEWSRTKGQLVLHVAYADVSDADFSWRDQSYIDTFELSFPTVHLDSSKNRLYVVADHDREINIGHLESGVFRTRVALNPDLEFSAHRQNEVVNGSIRSVSRSNR
jgi:hypothetical protein